MSWSWYIHTTRDPDTFPLTGVYHSFPHQPVLESSGDPSSHQLGGVHTSLLGCFPSCEMLQSTEISVLPLHMMLYQRTPNDLNSDTESLRAWPS